MRKYLLSPFTEKETIRNIRWMSRKMTGYVGAQKSCFQKNYMVYDEVSYLCNFQSHSNVAGHISSLIFELLRKRSEKSPTHFQVG